MPSVSSRTTALKRTSLGNLKTGVEGDGAFRKDAFFKFGTVGAGNVVLTSGGGEEFVTGLSISSNGLESARDFQPALVRCTDVTVPRNSFSLRQRLLEQGPRRY